MRWTGQTTFGAKVIGKTSDASLSEAIGAHGGFFATHSRRSFALHVLDELIHHGAEAAMMRDLHRVSTA